MGLVAVDVGGTHARFAQAKINSDGTVELGDEWKAKVADHPDFGSAWREFLKSESRNRSGFGDNRYRGIGELAGIAR